MKLVYKDYYTEQETKLALSVIDHEIEHKKRTGEIPKRFNKNIGPAYIKARIQELNNWKQHYIENTL